MFALLVTLTAALAGPGNAERPGDDTLRFYLSKSEFVVSGVTTNLMVISGGTTTYLFDFQVRDVILGDAELKGQNIKVAVTRLDGDLKEAQLHPLLRSGSECILFLRSVQPPSKPRWREADHWFAVHPHSPQMIHSLKQLAAERVEPSIGPNRR